MFDLASVMRLYCCTNEDRSKRFSFAIRGFLSNSPFFRISLEGEVAVRGSLFGKPARKRLSAGVYHSRGNRMTGISTDPR